MNEPTPQLTNDQAHAIAEQTVIGFGNLAKLIEHSVAIIETNGEIIQATTEEQKRDLTRRLTLASLTRDAGYVTEHAARQSAFLAKTSQRIEQRSGVTISPAELMCGILNGVEDSGLDLTYCGTREDVTDVIKSLVKQGLNAMRDKNRESD